MTRQPALGRTVPPRRGGFTIIELLIAMSVTLIVIAVAAPLYSAQTRAVNSTAGRTDASRSATFATDAIEQDLRNTGVGVFDGQPLIVRAAGDALSFNANMVTTRAGDLVAVFFDPDSDSTAVSSLTTSSTVTLPNSSSSYPSVTYNSNAETISYYTVPDTGTSPIAGGQMVRVMRRVNRMPEEIIARNVIRTPSAPLFRYFRRGATGALVEVPPASLPIFHSVPRHGAPADTGALAVIDSIAVVRLNLIALYRDPRGGTVIDTVRRSIRLANQGLLQRSQCGEAPLSPGAPALLNILIATQKAVRITWASSTDELAGERDVEMYAVYRRIVGTPDWGEPLANVPGGGTAIQSHIDNAVFAATRYDYAITALDCTPTPSAITPSASILVP